MKRASESGQATVEIALLLPVLTLFLLLIVHVGVIVRQYVVVTHASREAARVLCVENNSSRAQPAAHKSAPNAEIGIDRPSQPGQYLTVKVSDIVISPVPVIGKVWPSMTVSSTTSMRVEQ